METPTGHSVMRGGRTPSLGRTPILDWSDAESLRRELARVDARRVTIVAALASLGTGAVDDSEIVIVDSSASETSEVFDLTQETVAAAPRDAPMADADVGDDGADDDASTDRKSVV